MKHAILQTAALAAVVALSSLPAASQIIVGAGGDIQAAIDAAPSGSVIEIHSDETFSGPITFAASPAKDLSLLAGDGFAPTIDGGSDRAIKIELSDKTTRLRGLTLTATPSSWSIQMVAPPLLAGELQELVIDDCHLDSGLYVVHTGAGRVDLTVRDSTVENYSMSLTAINGQLDVLVRDTAIEDLLLYGSGIGDLDVVVEDSTITDGVNSYVENGEVDLELLRCRVEGPVVFGLYATALVPSGTLRAESTLFDGKLVSSTATGVQLEGTPGPGGLGLELVNCTVVDWGTGIELPVLASGSAGVLLRNTLLAMNTTDLTGSLGQAVVLSCLAEDQLLGGGSIQATAMLDTDHALLLGTMGTDAGDSLGLTLSPEDLYGNPRIVDVDCDGTAAVNIGAVEAPPSLLASSVVVALGNPLGTQTGLPVVGATLTVSVDLGSQGILAVVVAGAPLVTPLPLPGWTGSVLVDPVAASLYTTPTGVLQLQIPLDLGLVGAAISVQGARIEPAGAGVTAVLQNRVDLVLGY